MIGFIQMYKIFILEGILFFKCLITQTHPHIHTRAHNSQAD